MPDPSATGPYQPDPDDRDSIAAGTLIAGKYKLLEAIGEGGMGEVWMAQQIEPVKRTVAVKLIKSGMDSKTVVARFEAERQALSMMDHPNIARVFDMGAMSSGRPYFVMELVKGTPITEFCDQRKLTPRQRLELFVPVCLAIQHAHQKGIIHRDIKPTNVLVSLHDDKPVPKVIDFGVAKATGFTLTEKTLHTAFEQVVGTPAYMSPEQATFNQLDIDTRSDVYSLGVLLYELLTGTTPIERDRLKQAALLEMLRLVREEEPPRPSTRLSSTETKASIAAARGTEAVRLTKELRAELDWVVMKSLEKERTRRYESASAFAADIGRFLAGEAVLAHPPSASYRIRKFVRKRRGPVAAAVTILLALVGGVAGSVYGVIKADSESVAIELRGRAEHDRDIAELAKSKAVQAEGVAAVERDRALTAEKSLAFLNYANAVNLAHHEYQVGSVVRAKRILNECPMELRGWEWRYIDQLCNSELAVLPGHLGGVSAIAVSPDGRKLATASWGDTVEITNCDTSERMLFLLHPRGERQALVGITSVCFSRDSQRLATMSADGTARCWDLASGKELAAIKHQDNSTLAISPDGSRLLTGGSGILFCWDVGSPQVPMSVIFAGVRPVLQYCAFAVNGTRFVAASLDKISIYDAKSSKPIIERQRASKTFSTKSMAIAGDGRSVVCTDGRTCWVWDAELGKELLRLPEHPEEIRTVAFIRNGREIATVSDGGIARTWDATTGRLLLNRPLVLSGSSPLHLVEIAADGRIAIANGNSNVSIHNLNSRERVECKGHELNVTSMVFSIDSRRLITGSRDTTTRIWSAELPDVRAYQPPSPSLLTTLLSKNGKLAVTTTENKAILWDPISGLPLRSLDGHTGRVRSARFSEDDRMVITASEDGTARVFEVDSGRTISILKGHLDVVYSATLSKSGRLAATGSDDGTARLWDVGSYRQLALLEARREGVAKVTKVCFSNDERLVAAGCFNSSIHIWNAVSGERIAEFGAGIAGRSNEVTAMCFSPDAKLLAVGSGDHLVRLWQVDRGEHMDLDAHLGAVDSVCFSADGQRVLTSSWDHSVRIWHVKTGTQLLVHGRASDTFGALSHADFDSEESLVRFSHWDGENHVGYLQTRPARETFRKYLEAPPPRPVTGR